jgi:hypothetical protein
MNARRPKSCFPCIANAIGENDATKLKQAGEIQKQVQKINRRGKK